MDRLNSRQIEFTKMLLKEKDYKPIKYFMGSLKVSDKTLKKDLVIIEQYLSKVNVKLERKHCAGIIIKDVDNAKLILNSKLQFQENQNKDISINDRRIEIIKNMLINSHDSTSIQKLSDKYYVSKTSIANDFKYIEKWLLPFNLKLEKTVEGTQIKGTEVDIRRAIASLLFEYSKEDESGKNIIDELAIRLDASNLNALSELFEKEKIIYINKLLVDLEKKYNHRINDLYYINLLTHILISMIRGSTGKQIEINLKEKLESIKGEKAYKEAIILINKINKNFKMNLGESEVYYLYQYFISFGLIKDVNESNNSLLTELNHIAIIFRKRMTECIQEILQINIANDKNIMDQLLLHIRPMLNRMDYNIRISNPLMDDIKKQYSVLLNLCKAVVLMVAYELKQKTIPLDEIAYLTLYYQLALEHSVIKKRVLIVCHSGYGTSQLLNTRIKRSFPDFEIVDVLSINRIINRDLQDIDFIISTVPLDIKEKTCLLVSTFLNEYDIKNISDFLINDSSRYGEKILGTEFVGQYLSEDLIYFNTEELEVERKINKELNSNIIFNEIVLKENIKIQMGFYSKDHILGFCLNDMSNKSKQLVFYIAMNNIELMTQVLKEIFNLHINENVFDYLKRCTKKKDVKQYFKLNQEGEKKMEVDLAKVIKKETIKLNMEATTKDQVLEELTDLLYDAGVLSDKKAFLDDVYYRETLGSTGIGNAIAIPHGKSKFVNKTSLAFGKAKTDIEWETLDDKPVRFIILFAVTEEDKNSVHVRLLSKVAAKLGDDEACEDLLKATTPEEVYEIFTRSEENV